MFLIKDSWEFCHKLLMTMIKDVEGFFPYHHHQKASLYSQLIMIIMHFVVAFCIKMQK